MMGRIAGIRSKWRRFHLSLKGRVLIANSLMVSIPRYALRFLEMPAATRKALEKEYYRMIWDDKASGTIKDLQACLPTDSGGIGCFDLVTIADAAAVSMIIRAEVEPNLLWPSLVTDILMDTASATTVVREAVKRPWFQWLGHASRLPNEIKGTHARWKKLTGNWHDGPITIQPPETYNGILDTYFWYHPLIGVTSGAGARRWGSGIMRKLWDSGARVIGDIWNPTTLQPRIPNQYNSIERDRAKNAIRQVMQALPESWQQLLRDSPPPTQWQPPTSPRREFSVGDLAPEELTFTRIYKLLIQRKLEGISFNNLVAGPIEAYRARTGRQVAAKHVWRVARMGLFIPKAGDLLWRMLHQRVITGTRLHWIEEGRQRCPIHHADLTLQHIWLDCTVAQAVWEEASGIWKALGSPILMRTPLTIDEMLALAILSPCGTATQNERWHCLYRTAAWSIWKAYLTHSFGESFMLWNPAAAAGYYRELIRRRILTDRTLCLSEKHQNRLYNERIFQLTWGQPPREIKIVKGPACLNWSMNPSPENETEAGTGSTGNAQ